MMAATGTKGRVRKDSMMAAKTTGGRVRKRSMMAADWKENEEKSNRPTATV
jgi:hypothetical protein